MTALEVRTTRHGAPTVVAVIGPLNAHTTPALHEHLQRRPTTPTADPTDDAGEGTRVLLDLSCCTNIDIDGLLGLDVAHRDAKRRGIDVQLARVPALIERLINQHNFGHLMRLHSTTDEETGSGEPTTLPEPDTGPLRGRG
jgi:anti-anti-sigma regulatory factor